MKDNWLNKQFAEDWDGDAATGRGNPTRPEQLDILTSILADNYEPGKLILDIGSGSGLVEELLLKKRSDAQIVGIDSSAEMIELAKKRLVAFPNNFRVVRSGVNELDVADLPKGEYWSAFSVQVFHELTRTERIDIFKKIYGLLEPGGSLLILDRINIDLDTFAKSYGSIWGRLEKLASSKSGMAFLDYRKKMSEKDDTPATAEEYLELLREAGFEATILHLHFNRALIVGTKS